MKKWLITAALILVSATAANASWQRCETITVFPGFLIQRCEKAPRYVHRNYFRGHLNWWQEKDSHSNRYARYHKHPAKHYLGRNKYLTVPGNHNDRSHRRNNFK